MLLMPALGSRSSWDIHVSRLWHQPHMAFDAIVMYKILCAYSTATNISFAEYCTNVSTCYFHFRILAKDQPTVTNNESSVPWISVNWALQVGVICEEVWFRRNKIELTLIASSEWLIKPHIKRTSNTYFN